MASGSIDFRSNQIQTNKIIASGSTGTNAKILIYDVSADIGGASANQGIINPNAFSTSSIGNDVFVYISGSSGSIGTDTPGALVAGGDVLISGTLYVLGSASLPISGIGIIGNPESGTEYLNGLYTDFTPTTRTGIPVDRFNKVLSSLCPSPAPTLDDIGVSDTGASGKLSFGTSNAIATYTDATGTGSLPAVDVNGAYSVTAFSNDLRRGIFNATTTINGDLNDDVSEDSPNYPAKSFGNAELGIIIGELNGSEILMLDLTSTSGAITSSTGGGSFIAVSPSNTGSFPNGDPFDLFIHRTGVWSIHPNDQQNGWNVLKVVHQTTSGSEGSKNFTNYVAWVVDADATAITATNNRFDPSTPSMAGSVFLSGIEYYTGGTCTYKVDINNAYKNTYSSGNAITFSNTGMTISSQAIPDINTGAGEDETKVISVTGSATITSTKILNSYVRARISVADPLSDQLTNGGVTDINNILLYNLSGSSTSTNLVEDFRNEGWRLTGSSGFDNQSDIAANKFVSTTDRNGYGELFVYNERLVGQPSLANSGDFSGIANGPAGNVDYSSLPPGGYSYIRYFTNETGGSKSNFDLYLTGSGTIVTSSAGVDESAANIFVEIKIPGQSTGWLTLRPFSSPEPWGDGKGCLNGDLDSSLDAKNSITFGGKSVPDNDSMVVRLTASGSFSGYVSRMEVAWS